MNAQPSPALAVVLLTALVAAGCGSTDPHTRAATPRAEAMPVHAALSFSGPFRWVERDKAFEVAGARGPLGLDKPLRPLATLNWPTCPVRPINRDSGITVLKDRVTKPVAQCSATVRFGIAADGGVNNTQLIHAAQTEGAGNFGFNVVTTVNQWRFEPPMRGGKPTDICCVELSID